MFLEVQTKSGSTYLINTKNQSVSLSGNPNSIGHDFDGDSYLSGTIKKGAPMHLEFFKNNLRTSLVERIIRMDHEFVRREGALEITARTNSGSEYVFTEADGRATVSGGVFGAEGELLKKMPVLNVREKARIELADGRTVTTSKIAAIEYYRSRETIIDRPDLSTAEEIDEVKLT